MADRVVVDDPNEVNDLATAQALDEAERLAENQAIQDEMRDRARQLILDCAQQSEFWNLANLDGKWREAEQLASLRSLSTPAQEMNVHLCGAFRACEDFVTRMDETVFGNRDDFLDAEVEDTDDLERKEAIVALVKEAILVDAEFPAIGPEMFRDAADYGVCYGKVWWDRNTKHSITREVRAVEIEDELTGKRSTQYIFSEPEDVALAVDKLRVELIHPRQFLRPPTASTLPKASWCGDWSFAPLSEIQGRIERDEYAGADLEDAMEWLTSQKEAKGSAGSGATTRALTTVMGQGSDLRGESAQQAQNDPDIAVLEWWGNFDIKSNDHPVPCVITALVATDKGQPMLANDSSVFIVRVERNPYFHQLKPYLSFTPRKRRGSLDGISISEVAGKHSFYEDEAGALGLTGMYGETIPALKVGDGAEIGDDELTGMIHGRNLRVADITQLEYLTPPSRSQNAFAIAEFFERKSAQNVGLSEVNSAPRVAAAGIMEATQQEDLKLLTYLKNFEDCWMRPLAQMGYALLAQFMTAERNIKMLGVKEGHLVPDIRTIKPTDLTVGIRFEPMLTRKLKERIFETQFLMNWWDRMEASNMGHEAAGRGPLFDSALAATKIMSGALGWTDAKKIVLTLNDPSKLRTAEEENRMIAMGERPGVQRGENYMMHLRGHMRHAESAAGQEMHPEDHQYLVDHIWDTQEEIYRLMESQMPGAGDIVKQMVMQEMGDNQPSRPGRQGDQEAQGGQKGKGPPGQGGGRGTASAASGNSGGPKLRRPDGVGASSRSAGQARNS